MRYLVQIGAFVNAFDGMPTGEAAFKLQAVGALTPYGSGKFNSYEAAPKHANIMRKWAEDAFIKLIPVRPCTRRSCAFCPSFGGAFGA